MHCSLIVKQKQEAKFLKRGLALLEHLLYDRTQAKSFEMRGLQDFAFLTICCGRREGAPQLG